MKRLMLTFTMMACSLAAALAADPAPQTDDEKVIRKAVASYVEAISKEAVIAGTLHNSSTNTTQTIEGLADKTTQRVAWAVQERTRPIMETGISNLTKDSAPGLVHFEDGQTQQWLMVRLDEPAAKKALEGPKATPAPNPPAAPKAAATSTPPPPVPK